MGICDFADRLANELANRKWEQSNCPSTSLPPIGMLRIGYNSEVSQLSDAPLISPISGSTGATSTHPLLGAALFVS